LVLEFFQTLKDTSFGELVESNIKGVLLLKSLEFGDDRGNDTMTRHDQEKKRYFFVYLVNL